MAAKKKVPSKKRGREPKGSTSKKVFSCKLIDICKATFTAVLNFPK